MEQIVFPVPGICQFLTEETKHRLFTTTEQDEQGSKVSDFFDQSSFLHNEMEWQRKLRSEDQGAGGQVVPTPHRCPLGFPGLWKVPPHCLSQGVALSITSCSRVEPGTCEGSGAHVWQAAGTLSHQCTPSSHRHAADLLVLPPHDPVGQHLLQPGSVYQHHHRLLLPLRRGCVHR